ncbi:MAG: hypothetical protein J1F36_04030 [Clostridiales bacterium]|nr:hypothetical protein [Clostridiales bacterium]
MAKTNKSEEIRKKIIKQEKEKRFELATEKLRYLPIVTGVLIIVAVLMFFVNWVELYNSAMNNGNGGAEFTLNGWNFL